MTGEHVKLVATEVVELLSTAGQTVYYLHPHLANGRLTPSVMVHLRPDEPLEAEELTAKDIRRLLWEERTHPLLGHEDAVVWAIRGEGVTYYGLGLLVDPETVQSLGTGIPMLQVGPEN